MQDDTPKNTTKPIQDPKPETLSLTGDREGANCISSLRFRKIGQKSSKTDANGYGSSSRGDIDNMMEEPMESIDILSKSDKGSDNSSWPLINVETPLDFKSVNPEKFDIWDFLNSNRYYAIDKLESPYSSVWEMIDVPLYEDRVEVSESLEMSRNDKIWTGNITIENRTKINMSYIALASVSEIHFDPDVNWIGPNGNCKLKVTAPDQVVAELLKNGLITIITAPVYYKNHLDLEILKRNWKTPGSIFFSSCSLEWHSIRNIYYDESKYRRPSYPLSALLQFSSKPKEIIYPERLYEIPEEVYSPTAKTLKDYEMERRKIQALKIELRNDGPMLRRYFLMSLIIAGTVGFGYYKSDYIYKEISRAYPNLLKSCEEEINCSWKELDNCFYLAIQSIQNGLKVLTDYFLAGCEEVNNGFPGTLNKLHEYYYPMYVSLKFWISNFFG